MHEEINFYHSFYWSYLIICLHNIDTLNICMKKFYAKKIFFFDKMIVLWTIVQFIFHFWSFEISERILRSQKLTIGLDSYSRQIYLFIYLDPIWIFFSVFESTAYLKFTKLQYVFLLLSLQGHNRVTDED